ncbi:MAG TPA: hypothetical protein VFA05_04490 [Gaiellaceae bacterium]|nr:hypothetical protein [Gaiellaceae bacterium]
MAGRALLVVAVAAVALTPGAASAPASTRVIKLVSETIRVSGDAHKRWETDRLFDGVSFVHKRLDVVGSDRAIVIRYSATREWILCDANLPGGILHSEGFVRVTNGVVSVPVVNGTGRYAHARGRLLIWNIPNAPRLAENVYRLRR